MTGLILKDALVLKKSLKLDGAGIFIRAMELLG